MNTWFLGKYDCQVPSYYDEDSDKRFALSEGTTAPKAVVLAAFLTNQWMLGQSLIQSGVFPDLSNTRLIVWTKHEAQQLRTYCVDHNDIIIIAEDLLVEPPSCILVSDYMNALHDIVHYAQEHLRVDYSRFRSAQQAWRWRALRTLRKTWGALDTASERWIRAIPDHPWQEARLAYDTQERFGAVIDIRKSYASTMLNHLYPYPGPWLEKNPGYEHPCAMHCVQWAPTDTMGRFFNAYMYTVKGMRGYMAPQLNDQVTLWVLQSDMPWLLRHGHVNVLQTRIPTQYGPHPLRGSIQAWLRPEYIEGPQSTTWKYKLASAHSWTWQPKMHTVALDKTSLIEHYLTEYHSRPFQGSGHSQWNQVEDVGTVVSAVDTSDSGSYMPVAWTRLCMRSRMMAMAEIIINHGFTIAYVNVDGFHLRRDTEPHSMEPLLEELSSGHDSLHGSVKHVSSFTQGFWLAPGAYWLKSDQQWIPSGNAPSYFATGKWAEWCARIGTLAIHQHQGYWYRSNQPTSWSYGPRLQTNPSLALKHKLYPILRGL